MNSLYSDLKPEDIEKIRQGFAEIQSREDLFYLFLTVIESLPLRVSTKESYSLAITTLYKSGYPRDYRYFTIKKASGRDRYITAPQGSLKLVQSLIHIILSSVFETHPQSYGFRKGSSIVDNAAVHVGQYYVFNTDLKDFFTSITFKKIKACLAAEPFNLEGTKESIAFQISRICCVHPSRVFSENSKTLMVLPQGAPSSPLLSNIVCKKMDIRMTGLAKRFNANYTRYADDITFSANHNVFNENSEFRTEMQAIISRAGFTINDAKTRLQSQRVRQEVTGLSVNTKVNIHPAFVKTIRMYLHYWERYGIEKAQHLFLKDKEAHLSLYDPSLPDFLRGQLNFLRIVKGGTDVYRKLLSRLNKLLKRKPLAKTNDIRSTVVSDARFQAHRPRELAAFLRLFQDSNGLKYLTHDYDIPGSQFDRDKIVHVASREFSNAVRSYSLTRSLYARIWQFAFAQKPKWWRWKKGRMTEFASGWSSPDLRQWAIDNPGIHPIRSKAFRDGLINPFKESIQIRAPRLSNLLTISIMEKFQEDVETWKISYIGLDRAEFYTDTDILLGGIRHILDGIYERKSASNKVHISFRKVQTKDCLMKVLEITHVGSKCHKDAMLHELLNGNFSEAKTAFHGLCNWSIIALFNDGPHQLNILKDDDTLQEKQAVDIRIVNGFTHILSFY